MMRDRMGCEARPGGGAEGERRVEARPGVARAGWLLVACALSVACATAAQASPPDAGPSATAEQQRRLLRVHGKSPLLLLNPSDRAFVLARRGHLGVQLLELTPELREHFGAPRDAGVLVAQVAAGGPAAKAGVRVGDVLTAIDGDKVTDDADVRRRVRAKKDNETARLEVVRNRGRQNLTAQIALKETTELDLADALADRHHAFRFDDARVKDAVNRATRLLARPEFRQRLEQRREADEKLQERTRALEERIERLEKQLQGKK